MVFSRIRSVLHQFYTKLSSSPRWKEIPPALHRVPGFPAAILSTIGALIIVLDRAAQIIYFNTACERLTGYTFEEVEGRVIWDFLLPPEDRQETQRVFTDLREGIFPNEHENYWIAKDGGRRLIYWSNTALVNEEGVVTYIIGTGLDVTEERQAKQALQESEERYRSLVETTSDWIWEVDREGVYTYASPKVQELLGYEPSEVIGRTPFQLMPPEEAKRVKEMITPYFVAGVPFSHLVNVNLHKDGHEVILDTSGVPIFDARGVFCGFRGIDRDITEQKRGEEALQKSQARYRQFMHISAEGIWELQIDPPISIHLEEREQAECILTRAHVAECNEVFAHLNGYERPEEMIGLSLDELWQERHEVKIATLLHGIRSGYRITDVESSAMLPDGFLGYFLDNFIGLLEGDYLVRMWGTERDITSRRQMEIALRQSETRLRSLFAAMSDVILILDYQGRILEIAPTHPDPRYAPVVEEIGKTAYDYFPVEQATQFLESIQRTLETGAPVQIEYVLPLAGEVVHFAAWISPLSTDSVILVARDITTQVQERERLLAVERARANLAEHMNTEINHRARNNLAMVSGLLYMQAYHSADPHLASALKEAVTRIHTFVNIHEQIYATNAEHVDLLKVLHQMTQTLQKVFSAQQAEFIVEGESFMCPTQDATNLAVAINELLTNALKHSCVIPEGRLRIRVRLTLTADTINLSVWNSGAPIPSDFNLSSQSGMGLRMVLNLAEQYGGSFTLHPEGEGTQALLVIPKQSLGR